MTKMMMTLIAMTTFAASVQAASRSLSCKDDKLSLQMTIDEEAKTLAIDSGSSLEFKIYGTKSYQAEGQHAGEVKVYDLNDATTKDGRHFSGEVEILGQGKKVIAAISIQDDDLANKVWVQRVFQCKDVK